MSLPELGARLIVRRCSDGSALPIITTPGGKLFVLSEEGLEYEVVLQADKGFPVVPANMAVEAELKVDGEAVGYLKTNLLPNSTIVFEGFCIAASEYGASTYRRFKFSKAEPSRDMGPQVTDPEQIKAGRITLELRRSVAAGLRTTPPSAGAVGGGAALGHLPEGKKFFLAPSLKTAQGNSDYKQVNWCKTMYTKVATLGVMELRYETASTLMLRGHLNKTNPAHRQLLRASRDPTVLALLGDSDDEGEDQESRAARGGARRLGAPGAPAPGVKRERGAEGGGARVKSEGGRFKREPGLGSGSAFLDLTKPQEVPLRVGGREVKADEIAVWDLLDSDGEQEGAAPRWEVRKRQAVDLEGA